MNDTPLNGDALRLDDLLTDRALFGLDAEETRELDRLLAAAGRTPDGGGYDDGYGLAAAAVAVAETAAEAPMPAALRSRVLADHADTKVTPATSIPQESDLRSVTPNPGTRLSWVVAAVAAGLLVSVHLNRPESLAPGQAIANARTTLIAEAEDLVRIAWTPQDDAAVEPGREGDAPYGDVVWSDAAQAGYLRFRGLRVNDPTVEQYQLWVFDEARTADYPIDGGVFDVTETGEVLVPIDARLPVTRATLFAITVEKPGGVVVSDRSRLPLLAQR